MVVDDAVVVRGLVSRWIEEEPGLSVVASLRTGREAVDQLERVNPDVVILDIEMPDLDGISALPLLLAKKRDLVVIMASTLTRRNAEISLKALSLGAADYIPKPETNRGVTTSADFRRELIEKIRELGAPPAPRADRRARRTRGRRAAPARCAGAARALEPARGRRRRSSCGRSRRPPPRVLLIGSSTGGPQALNAVVVATRRGRSTRVPVLITQHMPPTFTTILAEHLARASGRPAREAGRRRADRARHASTSRPAAGTCRSVARDGAPVIALDDGPLVNFCKPAVDPLFSSAPRMWGSVDPRASSSPAWARTARDGAADIVAAGGSVIAQDEATSVVWGMPGAVAHAGVCSAVLPLDQIAAKTRAPVFGRAAVTPLDYDYLRKLLKERSGLVLSADKQYLVESRLLPVARKARRSTTCPSWSRSCKAPGDEPLDRRRGRGDDDQRDRSSSATRSRSIISATSSAGAA